MNNSDSVLNTDIFFDGGFPAIKLCPSKLDDEKIKKEFANANKNISNIQNILDKRRNNSFFVIPDTIESNRSPIVSNISSIDLQTDKLIPSDNDNKIFNKMARSKKKTSNGIHFNIENIADISNMNIKKLVAKRSKSGSKKNSKSGSKKGSKK